MTDSIPLNYRVAAAQVAQFIEGDGNSGVTGAKKHTVLGTVALSGTTPASVVVFPNP
jgi:hypothetical protein